MVNKHIVKFFRNENELSSRQEALNAIQGQADNVSDGELILARYKENDKHHTIIGLKNADGLTFEFFESVGSGNTTDFGNYYTKSEIDLMLKNIPSSSYGHPSPDSGSTIHDTVIVDVSGNTHTLSIDGTLKPQYYYSYNNTKKYYYGDKNDKILISDIKSCEVGTGVNQIVNLHESEYINSPSFTGNIEFLTLPETVTTIESNFLYHCDSIKKITLPKSLTKIYPPLFEGCKKLEFVCYRGTMAQWADLVSLKGLKPLVIGSSIPAVGVYCQDGFVQFYYSH